MRLTELTKPDSRTQVQVANDTSDSDMLAMWGKIEQNASEAIAALQKNKVMYRGVKNLGRDPVYLIDPKLKARKSANTRNHYTKLFDNLPSWRAYPKRSRSIICSTDKTRPSLHGKEYVVLPLNGAKIAICPTDDIWDSFDYVLNGEWMRDFNGILGYYKIPDTSYKTMIAAIFANRQKLARTFRKDNYSFIWQIDKCATIPALIKELDEAFNPKDNGFLLGTVNSIPTANDYELWTDSAAYFIQINTEFYTKFIWPLNTAMPNSGTYL